MDTIIYHFAHHLIYANIAISIMAIIAILLKQIFKYKVSNHIFFALWLMIMVRAIVFIDIPSPISLNSYIEKSLDIHQGSTFENSLISKNADIFVQPETSDTLSNTNSTATHNDTSKSVPPRTRPVIKTVHYTIEDTVTRHIFNGHI